MSFPSSPANDATYTNAINTTYRYDSTKAVWNILSTAVMGATGIQGIGTYWTTVPGSPTRVDTTTYTLTDTNNANLYDKLLSRGTVLKWVDNTGIKMAMVSSAAYSANVVTENIIGDLLPVDATMASLKYASEKSRTVQFSVAGALGVGTDIAGRWYTPYQIKPLGCDAYDSSAGVTNATSFNIKHSGSTGIFGLSYPAIATATLGITGITCADNISIPAFVPVQLDCTTVSTTAPTDAWVNLFWTPFDNRSL